MNQSLYPPGGVFGEAVKIIKKQIYNMFYMKKIGVRGKKVMVLRGQAKNRTFF